MQEAAATGLALALVLVLPGLLALVAARVRLSSVEIVALVPAVSLGSLWVAAQVVDLLGIAWSVPVYAVTLGVLAALAIWRTWSPREVFVVDVESTPQPSSAPPVPSAARAPRVSPGTRPGAAGVVALALLALGILIGGATWVRAVQGHDTTPPNFDSSSHGFMISRIQDTGATDAATVVVSDPRGGSRASDYYPLALHSALAVGGEMSGAGAADLLTGTVIAMGAIVLPCGLYALTRRVLPELPLAAGFAAVLGVLFSLFPYKPIGWGGITLIAGVSMLPAVIVLVERTVVRRLTVAGGALAAVCAMSVLAVHNSQIPMLGLLVVLLLLEVVAARRSWRFLGESVVRLAVIGAASLVLYAPTMRTFFGGVSERSDFQDTTVVPLDFMLGKLVTLQAYLVSNQGWLALLALVGAGVLVWRHRPAWVAGGAIVVALVVAKAVSDSGLVDALTFAWYGQPERLAYYLVYFVPVFGGITLAAACGAVTALARAPRTRRWLVPATAVAVLAVVAVAGGTTWAKRNKALVNGFYSQNTPAGPSDVVAFDWLGRHASKRGLVLTDGNADGSLWMYSFSGANPLFGAYPARDSPFFDRSMREREYVRSHITDLGRDQKLGRLLDQYDIRYVYYGDGVFTGARHQLDLGALRRTPGLREVFSHKGSHVFAISRS